MEVTVSGNYYRLVFRRGRRGPSMVQEYRNHLPYGQPIAHHYGRNQRPLYLKRIREMYRARKR